MTERFYVQPLEWFKMKKQADLAQSLADALEGLYSAVTDIRGIDMNTYAETELTQARAALKKYRGE